MKARLIKHIAEARKQRLILIKAIEKEEKIIKEKEIHLNDLKQKLQLIENFFDTLI